MRTHHVLAAAVLVGSAVWAGPLAAQEGPPPQPPAEPDLAFEREVFTYPEFERRNPFLALVGDNDAGPRYEQLELLGIMYSADPARSRALLGRRGATPNEEGGVTVETQATNTLGIGESWGNVRVVRIERTEVVLEVTEFGVTDQRTMELTPGGRQGGSR